MNYDMLHVIVLIYIYIYILYRVVWMHLLAPNVTSVYTISESRFPKVKNLMNQQKVDILWLFMIYELMINFNI